MQTLTFHLLKFKFWLVMWVKDNTTKSSDQKSIPVTHMVEINTKLTATSSPLFSTFAHMHKQTHMYINMVHKHIC